MKILMFNHEFPPIGGGGGWVSYFLGKHFAAAGHEVHLITSQFKARPVARGPVPRERDRGIETRRSLLPVARGPVPREHSTANARPVARGPVPREHSTAAETVQEIEGFHVHRVPALRKNPDVCAVHEMLTYAVSSSVYGLKFAKKFQPDITQVFFGIPAGGGAYLLKKFQKVPYVVFLGGRDVPRPNPDPGYYRWLYLLLKPVIRAIWGNASMLVACSDGLRELAQETDANVNINVIPDGLDLARFEPAQREAHPETVRILTIGRLIPRKGFQFLIRALPHILAKTETNFEIEIVGDGPYRDELLQLAESLGVASHIHFAGSVPYAELPEKYRCADIFILPSLAEGMPLVVLEAMGTGLPIVASRVQGIDELVAAGVNGEVFDPGDVDGLARCIVKLINAGEQRIAMGKASIERVKPYDWKHIADAYLALYAKILADSSPTSRSETKL